ncbi:MAG: flagellar hook-associated protein FlgK [Firmicutes bacterium ZCTH02-B6]|nr:MAG: flagellar hook-associated protein FlgK [Firmicutes bacterium ZCTH02-B6]
MRPTFFGLDIARRALQAQMRALDVVGHNIANANTPGYSRQVAVFGTTDPYPAPSLNSTIHAGQVGTGVQVEAIRRLRDEFVEMQLRNETESLGRWNARYEALQQVELFLQEPSDTGLRDALDQFWQSLQDLHQQPESDAARAVVRERALLLAASFQHVHKQLTDLRLDLNRSVALEVQKINTLAERLANLNAQIHRVHLSGQAPNDLLDERDQLILELAEIVDISVIERDNLTVQISVNGFSIVDGEQWVRLEAKGDSGNDNLLSVYWGLTGQKLEMTNGRLAGVLEARDELVAGYLTQLDKLAETIINEFNAVHRAGYTLEQDASGPIQGGDFFVGAGAKDIWVHDSILGNLRLIAASKDGTPGSGENAVDLAAVFHTPDVIDGVSIADYLRSMISGIGVTTQQARSMVASQSALVDHLHTRREAVSGVSLDEEMIDMVRFQQAYAAAARLVTAMDEALETIILRMGVVGR